MTRKAYQAQVKGLGDSSHIEVRRRTTFWDERFLFEFSAIPDAHFCMIAVLTSILISEFNQLLPMLPKTGGLYA